MLCLKLAKGTIRESMGNSNAWGEIQGGELYETEHSFQE